MNLSNAIKVCARFCGEPTEALGCIRFLSEENGMPPRLLAMSANGVGVFCKVDCPLPSTMALGKELLQAAKDELIAAYFHEGRLFLRSDEGFHAVNHWDPVQYPWLPSPPASLMPVEEWQTLAKLVRLPATVPGRSEMSHLSFLEDRVEAAIDDKRLAIADVRPPIRGLVPVDVFQRWPRDTPAAAATDKDRAWFKVGHELRFAPLSAARPVDVRKYVPEWHEGSFLTMSTPDLMEAARLASVVDGCVRLEFGVGGVTVRGKAVKGERAFEQRVGGSPGLTGGQSALSYPIMMISGPFLIAALRVLDTPCVRLCYKQAYQDGRDYLRLESGGWVEHIYAMRPDAVREAA